ncbi:putative fatty acyl-CoA reductase CG5065 isoform X2 [Camponotus floridanus]|uniref:putative fatty acyl-CoA reductase CG5065 isoform X2 n=1 Tax=Camponotus floridanus TaxID=104421 RepID=UPI000DC67F60|nr:putative fatty acyl-CoA reductase CG5065 isoform X2 [Camponotus floridanus]
MCETSSTSTAMNESNSEIQSFYKNKTIFITGATGFMGKVLIEKLLYSCSDLDKIYILIRAKKDRSCNNRLEDIFKLPLFQRIQIEKPQVMKKVIPFNGDICSDNLGLTDEERERLINEVNIVFHCAAGLHMHAKLKDAVEINMIGTKRVLNLGKEMKHLQAFIHLSTAFCHVDQKEVGERTYDSSNDPEDIIRLVQCLDEDTVDLITPKLLRRHPNTYIYSKHLAEKLVVNEFPELPCCIARPSIVFPSYKEPLPGWVDNLNGPIGILVGGGKGIIRSMHCNGNYNAEIIPVDLAINDLIIIAYKIATSLRNSESILVVNMTSQIDTLRITWSETLKKGKQLIYEYPFERQIWYPGGDLHSNKFVHNIIVLLFQIIPAYFIDFLMLVFRRKRFMVRIQKKILNGLAVLQYFTTRQWIFYNKNIITLCDDLTPLDKKIFPTIIYNIGEMEYFKHLILGTRQYCMKEDLSTLPKARRHQKMMYVIHITTIYLFYYGVLYLIYNNVEIVRFFFDYVIEKIKSILFIRKFIEHV